MIDTIKDNSSNNNDRKLISAKNKNGETVGIPTRQRALILQGGGALGAYEIGVLQSIYKHLAKNNGIVKKSERTESMFDIIAGVSIGAINAVFLVDQILKKNSWDNSIALLERFWDNFIAYTLVDRNPLFDFAWNTTRFFNKDTASLESARRYWSFYELACTVWPFGRGFSPNLCTAIQKFDSKFLSPLNNCLLYDFRLLRDLLTKTAKIDGDEENLKQKHVVCYNGIGEDQLMASCLFPYSNYHPTLYDLITNEIRTYWDGAFLSNTPLRELLQRHREFWENYFHENNIKYDDLGLTEEDDGGKKNNEDLRPRVPDLEVFIVNLYPALERLDELIPSDKDKIEDRLNDIRFHDRTKYDEKVADIVTDYIDLSRELITLAKQNGVSQKTIDDILAKKGESKKRNIQEKRQYRSLLEGRFRARVYSIQRQDDGDTIFGKASDYSYTTVKDLIDRGRRETDDWFKSDYKLR